MEYYLQFVIDSLARIREDYSRISIDDVNEINVHLNEHVFRIANPDNLEGWSPRTKETADHSLPWVLAIALIHGTVDLSHHRAEYYSSNETVNVMRKIKVNIDSELNKHPLDSAPIRIIIKLRSGREVEGFTAYLRGHVNNPMSEDEVEEKFRRLTGSVLTREEQEEVIRLVKDFENLTNINTLIKALTQT